MGILDGTLSVRSGSEGTGVSVGALGEESGLVGSDLAQLKYGKRICTRTSL